MFCVREREKETEAMFLAGKFVTLTSLMSLILQVDRNIAKVMKLLFSLSLLGVVTAQSQSVQPDAGAGAAIDPDRVQLPPKGINFPGCFSDLFRADRNGDGVIKQGEYLGFIQEYSRERLCLDWPALTLQQAAAFNSLACICRSLGQPTNCCIGPAAQIPTAGAITPNARTEADLQYLTATCIVTDGTLPPSQCPPIITPVVDPPLGITRAAEPPVDDGLSTGALWGIIAAVIAALLLLLLCCCCIVIRRRRQALLEEEEEAYDVTTKEQLEQGPEQAPGGVDGVGGALPGALAGGPGANGGMAADEIGNSGRGGVGPDDDMSEEGRKRRGQVVAGEEDDEPRRRLYGEGEIPDDPNNPERVILNPIPPKDPEEDPDWDQPGRDINYPRDSDEMSAGRVDHYDPDGGVNIPEREGKSPVTWKRSWEREKKEAADEIDNRKRRVQDGYGEGEVWDKLGEQEDDKPKSAPSGDVFDWVVQSALGVLDNTDQAAQQQGDEQA